MRKDTALVITILLVVALSLTLYARNVTGNVILRTFSSGGTFHVVTFKHSGVDTSTYIVIPKDTDVFYAYVVLQPSPYKGSYPSNVKVDVGGDGIDYQFNGDMLSPQKIDLKKAIGDKRGEIPIVITSDSPGKITLTGLEISYGYIKKEIKQKGGVQPKVVKPNEFNLSYFDDFSSDKNVDYSNSKSIEVKNGVRGVSSGFFPGFKYFIPINISNPNGELTNYQVKLIVPYNSHMNSNFSDLRFSFKYSNGTEVEVPYWIQSYSSSSATVWVKVPDLKTGNTTIYMYYGNPNATSESNGDAVFIFFDDFNGNSLNTSKWNEVTGGGVISVSNDRLYISHTSVDSRSTLIYSKSTFDTSSGIALLAKYKDTSSTRWYTTSVCLTDATSFDASHPTCGANKNSSFRVYNYGHDSVNQKYSFGASNESTSKSLYTDLGKDGNYHIFEVRRYPDGNVEGYIVDKNEIYDLDINVPGKFMHVSIGTRVVTASDKLSKLEVDYVILRSFVSPEPSVSFGSEESASFSGNGTVVTEPISFPINISSFKDLKVNVTGNVSFYIASQDLSNKIFIGSTNSPTTFDLSNIDTNSIGQHPRLIANLSNSSVLYSWNLSVSGSDNQPPSFNVSNFETYNETYSFNLTDFSGISSCWLNYNDQNFAGTYQNGKCNLNLSTFNYSTYNLNICAKDSVGNQKCKNVNVTLMGKITSSGKIIKPGKYKVFNDVDKIILESQANVDFQKHFFNRLSVKQAIVKNARLKYGKIINEFNFEGKNINISEPSNVVPPKGLKIIQLIHVNGSSGSQLQINFTKPYGYSNISIYEHHGSTWEKLPTQVVGNKLVSPVITSFSDIGVLGTPVEDWPTFHHDFQRTGYTTSPGPVHPVLLWKYTTGSEVRSSPAISNGIVYVGSGDHNIYALNATNGNLIWEYTTGNWVESSPAISNGIVYVGSDNIYALNATNGNLIWNYTTEGGVGSSPAISNGIVYVGSDDHNIYALNATNGNLIWKYTTGDWVYSSPAISNGIVYVGSWDDNVYALNATNGNLIWNYATGDLVDSSPAISNGIVYVGSRDHNIYALNATNGNLIWKYTTGSWVLSSPAISNGIVYVGSDDGNIYALNATNGNLIWKYTTGDWVYSSPAISNGIVYVGSDDGNIYALNATNGNLIWKYTTGDSVDSSPAISNGIVYVGSYDGNIYAFAEDTTPPSVAINFPQNKTYTQVNLINVTVTDNTGVDKVIAEIDGSQNITLINQPGTNYYYNDTVSFTNGQHKIRIYANDTAGNLNDTQSVVFTVDTIPPSVTINSPKNTTYDTSSITINVTVTDNTGVDKVIAEIDGSQSITLVNQQGTNYYYNDTVSFTNGQHKIRIYANDTAGNLNDTQSVVFTIVYKISNCPFVINEPGSYEVDCPIINSTTGAPGYGVLVNTSNVSITCVSPTVIVAPDTSFISINGDNVSVDNCSAALNSDSKVIKLNTTSVSLENLKINSNGNYIPIVDNIVGNLRDVKNVSIEQPSKNVVELKGTIINVQGLHAKNLILNLTHPETTGYSKIIINNTDVDSLILNVENPSIYRHKIPILIVNSSMNYLSCDIDSDCLLSHVSINKLSSNSTVSIWKPSPFPNSTTFINMNGSQILLNSYNIKLSTLNKEVITPPNTTRLGPVFNLTSSYGNNLISIWENHNPQFGLPVYETFDGYQTTPKNIKMLSGDYYSSVNLGDSFYRLLNKWSNPSISNLEVVKYNSNGDVVARMVMDNVPNLYPYEAKLLSDGNYLYLIFLSSSYPSNSFHVMKLDKNLEVINDISVSLPIYNIDSLAADVSDKYVYVGMYVYNNSYNYTLFRFDKDTLGYTSVSRHILSGLENLNIVSASNNGVVVSYLYYDNPNTWKIDSYSPSLELLGSITTTNEPRVVEFNNTIYTFENFGYYSRMSKYDLYLNNIYSNDLDYQVGAYTFKCEKYEDLLIAEKNYWESNTYYESLFILNASSDHIVTDYNIIPEEIFRGLDPGYAGFDFHIINNTLYLYKAAGAGDYIEEFYFGIKNWTEPNAMTKMSYSGLCYKFNDSLWNALRDARSNVELLSFWKQDGDKWEKIPSTFNETTMTLCTTYLFTGYSNVTILASEDLTPPSVKFVYPKAGIYTSNITKLQLNITDASGVSTAYVSIGTKKYSLQYNSTTGYWENHNINLGPGTYTAYAWANDTYGNINNSVSVTFTVLNTTMVCDRPSGLYVKYDTLPKHPNAGSQIYLYGIACNGTKPLVGKDTWFFYEKFPVDPIVVANWTWENATREDPVGSWAGWKMEGDFDSDFASSWTNDHPFDRFFDLGHLSKYCAEMYNSFADSHGRLYKDVNVYADSLSFYIKYGASTDYGNDSISAVVTLSNGERYHFILHTHGFTIPSNTSTDYYFDYRNDSYANIWRPVVIPLFEIQKSLHPGEFYNITSISFEIEASGDDSSHGASIRVDDVYLYNYKKVKTSSDGSFGLDTKAFPFVRNITSYVHVDYDNNARDVLENSTKVEVGNKFTISIIPSDNNIQPYTPINVSGRAIYANGNPLSKGLPYKLFLDGEIQSVVWTEIGSFDFESGTQGWDYFGNSPGYETTMKLLTDSDSYYNQYLSLDTINNGKWRYMGGLSFYLPSMPGYIDKIIFHFKPMKVTHKSWMEFQVQVNDRGIEKTLHFFLHNESWNMPSNGPTDQYIYLDHTTTGDWSEFFIQPYAYKSFISGKKIFRILFRQAQEGGGNELQFGIDRISFMQGSSGNLGDDGYYNFTKLDNSKLTPGGHWISVELTDEQGVTSTNETYLQVLPVLINIESPTNNSIYKNVWLNVTSNSYMKLWGYELDGKWYKLNPGDAGVGQTDFNISITGLGEGLHKVKVNGTTLSNAYNETDYVYFYVDNTPPKVYLVSPLNNSLITNSQFNLTFKTIDGLSKNMNCVLHVNNSVYNINNVPNNTNYNFTIVLSDGTYEWWVNCSDQAGNWNVSNIWYFTVNAVPPGVFVSDVSSYYNIYVNGYVDYTSGKEENVSIDFYNADWWDKDWEYRMPVTLPEEMNWREGIHGMFIMDTANLIREGKMNSNCSDIRIVGEYENESSSNKLFFEELPYHVVGCNSTHTKVYFEAPIMYDTLTYSIYLDNLFVYYGNPSAGSDDINKVIQRPEFEPIIQNVEADVSSSPNGFLVVYNKSYDEIGLIANDTLFNYSACSDYNSPKVTYGNGKIYIGYSYSGKTNLIVINSTNMKEIGEFNLFNGNLTDLDNYNNYLRIVLENSENYTIIVYDPTVNSIVKKLNVYKEDIPFTPSLIQFVNGTKYLEFYNSKSQQSYLFEVDSNNISKIGTYPGFVFRNGDTMKYLYVNNTIEEYNVYSVIYLYNFDGTLNRTWMLPSGYSVAPSGIICGGNHCLMFDSNDEGYELSDVEEPFMFDAYAYSSGAYYNNSFLIVSPGNVNSIDYGDPHYYPYGYINHPEPVNDLDSVWYVIKNDTQTLQTGVLANSGEIYSKNFTVNLPRDGDYYVQIYANDTVGHKSQVDMRVVRDTTPPTVSMNVLHSGDYILINYTSIDRDLDYCEYYINGTYVKDIPCSGELNITPEIVGTGTFDVEIDAYDKVGNDRSDSVVSNINCVKLDHKFKFNVVLPEINLNVCRGDYTFNGNGSLIENLDVSTTINFNDSIVSGNSSLINATAPITIENAKIENLSVVLPEGSALINDTFINSSNTPGYEELFGIICPSCYLGDNLTFVNSPILLDSNVYVSGTNITYNGRPMLVDTYAQNKLIKSDDKYGAIYLFNTNNTTIEVNLTNGGFLFVDGIGGNTENVIINNSNIINSKGLALMNSGYSWKPGTLVENSKIINNTVGVMFLDDGYELKMNNSIVDKNKYVVGGKGYGYISGGDQILPGPSIIGGVNKSGDYWQTVQEYDYDGNGIGNFPYRQEISSKWGGTVQIDDEYPLANMTFKPQPTSSSDWITPAHDLHNTYASTENGAKSYNKILFTKESSVPPVVADGKLFTATNDVLIASDANTGNEIWSVETGELITGLQYYSGIICASEERPIFASCYNATNGKWIMPSSEHDVLVNDTLVMFDPGYKSIIVSVVNVSTGEQIYSYTYSGYSIPQTVYDNNIVYYYSPESSSHSEVGFINVSNGENNTWNVNLIWNGNPNWIGIKYYDGYAYFFGEEGNGNSTIMRMNTSDVYPVVEVKGNISEFWKQGDVLNIINYTGKLSTIISTRVEYNLTSGEMKVKESYNGLMYHVLNPDGSVKLNWNVSYGGSNSVDVCGNSRTVSYVNLTIGNTKFNWFADDVPSVYVWQNKTYVWSDYGPISNIGMVYVFGKAEVIPRIHVDIYGPGIAPLVSGTADKAGVNLGEIPSVGIPYFVKIGVTDVSGAPLSSFQIKITELDGNSLFAVSNTGYSFNGMVENTSEDGTLTMLIAPTGYNLNGYKIKIGTVDDSIYGLVGVTNSKKIMNVTNYDWSDYYCNNFKNGLNQISPYLTDAMVSSSKDIVSGINANKSIHYNISIGPNGIEVSGQNELFYNAINEFNISAPAGWKVSLLSNRPCVFIGSQGYGISTFSYESSGNNVFVDFDPLQPPVGFGFNITLVATNGTTTYNYTFTNIENGDHTGLLSKGIHEFNYVSPLAQNLLTLVVNLNNNINVLNGICGG